MSGLFGGTPSPPPVPPPVRQPTPGDAANMEAQRQAQARLLGMPGREATDLTDGDRRTTGYTGTVLGK